MFESLFAISFVGAILLYIADLFIRPWKYSQDRIKELERRLNIAREGGLKAKLLAWLNAPKLRGNLQLYQKLLEVELEAEKRRYEIYSLLRRGDHV
ncbi:hypothetical protein [Thermococcus thioreducens]|uniref:Uncharacterized protein n=1 Tax=Thermococcus thioreducens TaxID=277988 RepID=A0A0Q2M5C0_9EURY|nr:hypothetical protein [Thermococcus thioreducens]ASJ13368.1 hypothetical protein A3L14_10970 [Thermococcus thioreducens]KQH83225.1 hypothetical protein AMR53_00640 [Thermococcus thioreducens]SEW23346.1 hypothetical protein SAMN05216170_2302 [Thermococcus thioreducens]